MSEKSGIDFVIPWVDSTDLEWLKARQNIAGTDNNQKPIIINDYRDWGLLKYWFRAVEKYAPWVDKIHFITYGHLPEFLNVKHPKINIVNHIDYIPKEYLPTFSSHPIELNIHRIKNLSEKFVYFNDDIFLVNKVKPEDFFVDDLPCDSAVINPVAPSRYDSISTLMINNVGIINQNFYKKDVIRKNWSKWYNLKYGTLNMLNLLFVPWSKFPGFYEQHLSSSFLKSSFEKVWSKEHDILHTTCMNKVRNFKTDVNQWLIKEWQIVEGNFYPRSTKIGDRYLIDTLGEAKKAADAIKKKKHKIICLNDHYQGVDIDFIINELSGGFEIELSEKSSFEI